MHSLTAKLLVSVDWRCCSVDWMRMRKTASRQVSGNFIDDVHWLTEEATDGQHRSQNNSLDLKPKVFIDRLWLTEETATNGQKSFHTALWICDRRYSLANLRFAKDARWLTIAEIQLIKGPRQPKGILVYFNSLLGRRTLKVFFSSGSKGPRCLSLVI